MFDVSFFFSIRMQTITILLLLILLWSKDTKMKRAALINGTDIIIITLFYTILLPYTSN